MIAFWTTIFYLSTGLAVFSILYIVYEKIRKKAGFIGFLMMSFSLFILIFSDNRVCSLIADEVISDLKSGKLTLEKNNILTNQNIYNLQTSSQKHNFSEITYGVTVLPSKDDILIRQDFVNNKFWVFYTKYHYSIKHPIGFIE